MSRWTARSARIGSSAAATASGRPGVATVAAAGLAAAALLGGCSAGQVAETAQKVPSVPGVAADLGDIHVRDAMVAFSPRNGVWPVGSDVPLQMRIINTGGQADQLLSVTTDVASAVTLRVVPPGGQLTDEPTATVSAATGTPTPTLSGVASPAPSVGTASPSPGVTAASPPAAAATPTTAGNSPSPSPVPAGQALPLTLAPESVVSLDYGQPQLVLGKVTQRLDAAAVITVELRFSRAGTLTLELPVNPPATPLPRSSLTHGDEGGEGDEEHVAE